MYGIIIEVRVDPNREEEVRKMLENMIVPKARTHKCITAGYWLRSLDGDILRTVQLYDTKSNAQDTADQIQSEGPPPGAPVNLISVNTYEVIAQV
jgi:hypothetical protein